MRNHYLLTLFALALNLDVPFSVEKTTAANFAQTQPRSKSGKICPDFSEINNICGMVDTQTVAPASSEFLYLYQQKMHDAACADPKLDSPSEIRVKIQKLWNQHGHKMTCDAFGLQNGYVLKFAVDKRFHTFLEDAVEWGVPLNRVDLDGLTTLDYIEHRMKFSHPPLVQADLREYRSLLIKGGAKRRSELTVPVNTSQP